MQTIKEYDLQILREKVDYLENKGKKEFESFQADREAFDKKTIELLAKAVRFHTDNKALKELLVEGKVTIKKLKDDAKPPKIVDADGKIADLKAQLKAKNLKLRRAKGTRAELNGLWRDYDKMQRKYLRYCSCFKVLREELFQKRS